MFLLMLILLVFFFFAEGAGRGSCHTIDISILERERERERESAHRVMKPTVLRWWSAPTRFTAHSKIIFSNITRRQSR